MIDEQAWDDPANAPRVAVMQQIRHLEGSDGRNDTLDARRMHLQERRERIAQDEAAIARDERALVELRIALDKLGGPIPEVPDDDEPPF